MNYKITQATFNDVLDTSFHDFVIRASKNEIVEKLGIKPLYTRDGKTHYNWYLLLDGKWPFTIYDYKEYGRLKTDDIIEYHIGWKSLFYINGKTGVSEVNDKTGFPEQMEACEMILALEERGLTVDHSNTWKIFHSNEKKK